MSACEECWTEASRKALMFGGHTADRYREELAAHPDHASESNRLAGSRADEDRTPTA